MNRVYEIRRVCLGDKACVFMRQGMPCLYGKKICNKRTKMKILKNLILVGLLTTLSMAQKEALLIGVSDYQGVESDLKGIEIDIGNMKTLFEKWGFHTTVLLDRDSMRIDEYLNQYHSLGADDAFAFYYSGHGSYTDDESGDESDGQDETLVLSNGVENRFYLDDNLNRHFNSIGAKKIIVFDSCHSGTAFKGYIIQIYLHQKTSLNIQLLMSTFLLKHHHKLKKPSLL